MFKTGDYVRLKTGNAKMRVKSIKYDSTIHDFIIYAEYVNSGISFIGSTDRLTLWEDSMKKESYITIIDNTYSPKKETEKMTTLYVTKNGTEKLYGTFLAKDSTGKYVLEMKNGADSIKAFDISEIEEVTPYTVGVKDVLNQNESNFAIKEGSVKVGDLLFMNSSFYIVKELNTKAKHVKEFNGVKLLTESIDG